MKEDDDSDTVLPPFPTHLLYAIVEKSLFLNGDIDSMASIIKAMINQDKSLHLFKDIDYYVLQERIILALKEKEIICDITQRYIKKKNSKVKAIPILQAIPMLQEKLLLKTSF